MTREVLLMLAGQVSPIKAQRYLLAKKWKLVAKHPRKDILLFNHRKDKLKQIVIPASSDYEMDSNDLLNAVWWLEKEEQRDTVSK